MWKWILFFNFRLNQTTWFGLLSLKSKSIKYQRDDWSRAPEATGRAPSSMPCEGASLNLWSPLDSNVKSIHLPVRQPSVVRGPRVTAGAIAARLLLSCWTTAGATKTSGRAIDKHISGAVAEGGSQSLLPSKYQPVAGGGSMALVRPTITPTSQ